MAACHKADVIFSVIIPCKAGSGNLMECIEAISDQSFSRYEIIVLPDEWIADLPCTIRQIPTGAIGPGEKRDLGVQHSAGSILAFIDDDAYPHQDWLACADNVFTDAGIVAVGGPGVTPVDDPMLARASGLVYESLLGGSTYRYRVLAMKARWVDDYPSMNLLVRKSDFVKVGGFDTNFYPGEDTKLCSDLSDNGGLLRYDPDVMVYHHRRPLFVPHLKQILNYGIHRGHFARVYPGTSLRIGYLLPSFWVLGLLLGPILAAYWQSIFGVWIGVITIYGILLLISWLEMLVRSRDVICSSFAVIGIAATHIVYGIGFLGGFVTRTLSR